MIHAWTGAYDYPIWRIYPDTERFAGGRYRAHVSVAKDRQCPGSRKETAGERQWPSRGKQRETSSSKRPFRGGLASISWSPLRRRAAALLKVIA
jgi:hypothetical protein